jgi:lysylphosphatidylglycerol synthetase-like protein (DUF2156 family)
MTTTVLSCPSDTAAAVLARHADNPSAFLALNRDTRHFTVPGLDGLVAYRPAGRRTVVQLGGPFAAPDDRGPLLDAFLHFARARGRRALAVQLLREDADAYVSRGFAVNQLGADYARSLDGFALAGRRHVPLRNKLSRARRAGVVVEEVPGSGSDPALDALDTAWLRSKGRHAKELAFLVGERGGPAGGLRRLFVARSAEGDALGYVSFAPAHGRHPGWLHDLSRRRPDGPPGVLELVVVTAVERFRSEGAGWLHFGFTPFTGLDETHRLPGASPLADRAVRLLAERGAAVYPAADQLAYKLKWAPDLVQPEYVAFPGRVRPTDVWALLRCTGAV